MAERRNRPASEKAQEALDTHQRKIKRVEDAITHQKEVLANYESQRKALQPRLEFLLADPDLPDQPGGPYSESAQA